MLKTSDIFWLWLSSAAGLRLKARDALLKEFGSPEAIFSARGTSLEELSGVGKADAELLRKKNLDDVDEILSRCEEQGLSFLTIDSESYPERLKNVFAPPPVLYIKGTLPDIDRLPLVSVIGTRKASPYGLKMGRELAAGIVRCGGAVVSLLTEGVDLAAAEGALAEDGICVGVLGTAHEKVRKGIAEELCRRGALISEYPPGTSRDKSFFRARNRIAAGLSLGVVVVEAPEKSGTRFFVEDALEQGKDIFAVPGNADADNSVGTIRLLKAGAKPAVCGWDIMSEYENRFAEVRENRDKSPVEIPAVPQKEKRTQKKDKKPPIDKKTGGGYIDLSEKLRGLTEEQKSIVTAVETGAATADEIINACGMSASQVLTQLTMLEIKGILKRDSARHFTTTFANK